MKYNTAQGLSQWQNKGEKHNKEQGREFVLYNLK